MAILSADRFRQLHALKTDPAPFIEVWERRKTHEVRVDDRDYRSDDMLHLRECDAGEYTGRSILAQVTYVTPGGRYGLPLDMCVMSIAVRIRETRPPLIMSPALRRVACDVMGCDTEVITQRGAIPEGWTLLHTSTLADMPEGSPFVGPASVVRSRMLCPAHPRPSGDVPVPLFKS